MSISHLVIDLGGVACGFNADRRLIAIAAAAQSPVDGVRQVIYGDDLGVLADTGELDAAQIRDRVRAQLNWAAPDDEFDRLWCSAFEPDAAVLGLLRRVPAGVRRTLFTNNDLLLREAMPRFLPGVVEVFDDLVFSADVRMMKPASEAFRRLLQRIGAPASEETFFVDDSSRNVKAAREVGLGAVQYANGPRLRRDLVQRNLLDDADHPRVLLIGGMGRKVVAAAADYGLEVTHLQNPQTIDPQQQAIAVATYPVDLTDGGQRAVELAEELHRAAAFDAVVSMTELGLEPAARIASRLGLAGASNEVTARLLRDKALMREHLAARDQQTAVKAALVSSLAQAQEFVRTNGLPVILKPSKGTASLAVRKVEDETQLAAAFSDVSAEAAEIVMEEFLTGPEFSVEAFSFDGQHRIVAITQKEKTENFVEMGHVVPSLLPIPQAEEVELAVDSFLTDVGISDGPSHTEIILTPAGPRVVESHDRLGGDRIFRLVELATGVDLAAWCFAWPFRLMDRPAPITAPRAAAIRFLHTTPGEVISIDGVEGPDGVRADPAVDELRIGVAVGDQVSSLRQSWDRIGHVIVIADDPATAVAKAHALAARIQIATRPTEG